MGTKRSGFWLQTIVCIPSTNSVVELGLMESIFQSLDLMNKVRVLFNFNNLEMGSWPVTQTDQGENDLSLLWLLDPSSSAIEIKDSINTTPAATAIAMTTVPTSVPRFPSLFTSNGPALLRLGRRAPKATKASAMANQRQRMLEMGNHKVQGRWQW
ncbi:hypothetical protein NE237_014579 [Protea cynaroides]|uniref:Uncharacterized protein n=1 Tax=Protea cynaroides TaxID=273540 RepID=A0A9Q0KC88_9MAGN|nr:hypothetical protein NE237_014579 [Protea cynaroides]